ncbi:unnamed protein product, partial [Pylaiella littoralis]
MFTGTADENGRDKSGDRLIKEGDSFGDEPFEVAVTDVHGTPSRITTAMTRTSPCELLVVPPRECLRLKAFVALRNRDKAMLIFEKFFINLPREAYSEIASMATFRTIKMNEKLAAAGDDVSAAFFVFRGECVSKPSKKHHQDAKRREETQRYGPGHIVGWQYIMPDAPALQRSPVRANTGRKGVAGAPKILPGDSEGRPEKPQIQVKKYAIDTKKRRPRRHGKEWQDTVTVTTPAQVLSVPLVALLTFLSEKAMQDLRMYISQTHKHKLEGTSNGFDDDDHLPHDNHTALGWSNFYSGGYDPTSLLSQDAGSKLSKRHTKPSRSSSADWPRPSTAPELAPNKKRLAPVPGYENCRPNTSSFADREAAYMKGGETAAKVVSCAINRFRSQTNTRTRWRWRMGLTDTGETNNVSRLSTASRGGRHHSGQSSSCSRGSCATMIWGYARGGERPVVHRKAMGDGRRGCCSCPMKTCRGCSPSKRLERLQNTPVWTPTLPPRSMKPVSAPAAASSRFAGVGALTGFMNTSNALDTVFAMGRPSTFGPTTTMATTTTPTACMYYIHPPVKEESARVNNLEVADRPQRVAGPGGVAGANTVLSGGGGAPTPAPVSSFKLWSRSHGKITALEDTIGGGGGGGNAMVSMAKISDDDDGYRRGKLVGGLGVVEVVAAPPMSDGGISTASLGCESGGAKRGNEVSTLERALDLPGERLSCTLVQLSTRRGLDPSDRMAVLCLRILGSFTCEAAAKTRVLNLYHSVLQAS